MSLSLSRNAKVKYTPKDKPTVTKLIYTKNKRTFEARIPKRSAKRDNTLNPCFSKKYFN